MPELSKLAIAEAVPSTGAARAWSPNQVRGNPTTAHALEEPTTIRISFARGANGR